MIQINLTKRFQEQYLNKPLDEQGKIDKTIDMLCENPKHPGLHSHRVRKTKRVWECYINRAHRVTFEYGDNCIICRNNCNHTIIDKNP